MAIETENLPKYYGNKIGCRDISISVGKGEIFGFLGHNGAGKSTFIKMLVGLLFPTSGSAWVLGKPVEPVSSFPPPTFFFWMNPPPPLTL